MMALSFRPRFPGAKGSRWEALVPQQSRTISRIGNCRLVRFSTMGGMLPLDLIYLSRPAKIGRGKAPWLLHLPESFGKRKIMSLPIGSILWPLGWETL